MRIFAVMNAPVKTFALTSVLGSLFLVRQVSRYAIAHSYIWTASVVFLVQFLAFATWKVILYPRFFSPLRHLPQPKVRLDGNMLRISTLTDLQ